MVGVDGVDGWVGDEAWRLTVSKCGGGAFLSFWNVRNVPIFEATGCVG